MKFDPSMSDQIDLLDFPFADLEDDILSNYCPREVKALTVSAVHEINARTGLTRLY